MKKVLVLAVHPDDETLGCGGTLLRHRAQGNDLYWLIATKMLPSEGFSQELILSRDKEIAQVTKYYGFKKIFYLDLPATRTDQCSINKIIEQISLIFKKVQPNIVYLPFKNDVHSDHQVLFDAAFSCTKNFRFPSVQKVLMMETISETEFSANIGNGFLPNSFVNIEKYFKQKIRIMKTYKTELGKHPFPRSISNIQALATYRGAMANCKYAEAFMLLKETW